MNQVKKTAWDKLNETQKKIIKKNTASIRTVGILLPGISLLWGRCYFTFLLLIFSNLFIPGIGWIAGIIFQYIYLSERAFNNSKGKLIKLVQGYETEADILNQLIHCATVGDYKMIKLFLDSKVNSNLQNRDGYTALMMSAFQGHIKILKLLINNGTNINTQNNNGQTALMLASLEGHTDTVKYLISQGADTTITDKNGYTALHFATNKEHKNVIELLKEK